MKKLLCAACAVCILLSSCNLLGGMAGKNGNDGKDGSAWYSGSGSPNAGLGVEGDFYLDTASSAIYSKGSEAWVLLVNVKGATGDTGDGGVAGATWLSGGSAPQATDGSVGDFYLDTSNGDIYRKAAGGWALPVMNLTAASIRKSETVAPGASIELDLSSIAAPAGKKLVYTGQFVKDGVLYPAAAAASVFPALSELYKFDGFMSGSDAMEALALAALDNSRCAVTYESYFSSGLSRFLTTKLFGWLPVSNGYGSQASQMIMNGSSPDPDVALMDSVATPVASVATSDGRIVRLFWGQRKAGGSSLGAPPADDSASLCLQTLSFGTPDADGYCTAMVDNTIWLESTALIALDSVSASLLPDGRIAVAWSGQYNDGSLRNIAKILAVDLATGTVTELCSYLTDLNGTHYSTFTSIKIAVLQGTASPTLAVAALAINYEGDPRPYYGTLDVTTPAADPLAGLTQLDSWEARRIALTALSSGDFIIAYAIGASGAASFKEGQLLRFGPDGTAKPYSAHFGGISGSRASAGLSYSDNYIDLPSLAALPNGGYALGFKSNPFPAAGTGISYNRQSAMIQAFGSGGASFAACELGYVDTIGEGEYYTAIDATSNIGAGGREIFIASGTSRNVGSKSVIGAYHLGGLTMTEALDGSKVSLRNDTAETLELRISVQR